MEPELLLLIPICLSYFINIHVFDRVYERWLFTGGKKGDSGFPWSYIARYTVVVGGFIIAYSVLFFWHYSRYDALSEVELWLAAIDVAWTHVWLLLPVALVLTFLLTCVTKVGTAILQSFLLAKIHELVPGFAEAEKYYEVRSLLIFPLIKPTRDRLRLIRASKKNGISLGWIRAWLLLEPLLTAFVAYPLAYFTLRLLILDTIDLQMLISGAYDPSLGLLYPSSIGFAALSGHVVATGNWLSQQPTTSAILGFVGIVASAILSLAALKKAFDVLFSGRKSTR